jgi:hypothetical protein
MTRPVALWNTTCSRLLLHLAACTVVAACVGIASTQDTPRRPVPDEKALAKAEELVRRVLAEDFERAEKEPGGRAKLIALLLEQGRETRDLYDARYVLFREARDQAIRAGDVKHALRAVHELGLTFLIDEPRLKVDALEKLRDSVKGAPATRELLTATLELAAKLLDDEAHDHTLRLAAVAEAAAAALADKELTAETAKRVQEIRVLHKFYGTVKKYADRLASNPNDPEASLEMGKYHAFVRGNWDRGLPLLARGSEPGLKKLADSDLAQPADVKAQLALGDGWRRLVKPPVGPAEAHLLLRAAHWYQQALLQLDGEEMQKVEQQLKAIAGQLPPGFRIAGIVALLRLLEGHQGNVMGVSFSHDGSQALTASGDKTVRLWDVASGKELLLLEGHTNWVRCAAFSPDGKQAVSCGDDNLVRVWDLKNGKELVRLSGHTEWVRSVAFLPGGGHVVSASEDRTVRLWDLKTATDVRRFEGHTGYVYGLAVSKDGKQLLTASGDQTVRLWEVYTGREVLKLDGHKGGVTSVAFLPDGKRAISSSLDRTLRLWDLEKGKLIREFKAHTDAIWSVAVSPDGRQALSGGKDQTLRLWDVATGREVRRLQGHTGFVFAVCFSPNGRLALSGGADRVARVWGEGGP